MLGRSRGHTKLLMSNSTVINITKCQCPQQELNAVCRDEVEQINLCKQSLAQCILLGMCITCHTPHKLHPTHTTPHTHHKHYTPHTPQTLYPTHTTHNTPHTPKYKKIQYIFLSAKQED